jgi:hypothetical protein
VTIDLDIEDSAALVEFLQSSGRIGPQEQP